MVKVESPELRALSKALRCIKLNELDARYIEKTGEVIYQELSRSVVCSN